MKAQSDLETEIYLRAVPLLNGSTIKYSNQGTGKLQQFNQLLS